MRDLDGRVVDLEDDLARRARDRDVDPEQLAIGRDAAIGRSEAGLEGDRFDADLGGLVSTDARVYRVTGRRRTRASSG
jgi:hypothetical protein